MCLNRLFKYTFIACVLVVVSPIGEHNSNKINKREYASDRRLDDV